MDLIHLLDESDKEHIDSDTEKQYEKDLKTLTKDDRYLYALARYHTSKMQFENRERSKPPSFREIGYQYGISDTGLARRYRNETTAHSQAYTKDQRLTPSEEQSLEAIILQLEAWGFPPYVSRVKEIGFELMKRRNKDKTTEQLGKNWVQKFLHRQPDLVTRWSQRLERDRANNCTPEIFTYWFQLFESQIQKYGIQRRDIYNMDEKGLALGQIGSEQVVCSKYTKNPRVKEPTNTEWVSLLECILIDGDLLPPFIIFKAKVQMEEWAKLLSKGGKICISDKGWTNNTLGFEWLKQVFNPYTKARQKGAYRMLILDGHKSHLTTEVIQLCVSEKIILTCLPAHTTHMLQPLDVSFFQPLAKNYKRDLTENFRDLKAVAVTKNDFLRIYLKTRTYTATESNIASAWLKTGLDPFNPQLVLDQLPNPQKAKATTTTRRPITPPDILTFSSTGVHLAKNVPTPHIEAEITRIEEKYRRGLATDGEMEKLFKSARFHIAQSGSFQLLSQNVIDQNEVHTQRKKASRKQLGKAQVLGPEVLQERELQQQQDKQAKEELDHEKEYWNTWKAIHLMLKENPRQGKATKTTPKRPSRPIAPPEIIPDSPAIRTTRSGRITKPKRRS